jgi:hypothetical protein
MDEKPTDDDDYDERVIWPTLATAIAAVEALSYIELEEIGEASLSPVPATVTLRELRSALATVKGTLKYHSELLGWAIAHGHRDNWEEWRDAHDWHAMVTWFSAIIAAAEFFCLDESDPVLDALRNSFPRGEAEPAAWPFRWQYYAAEKPRDG